MCEHIFHINACVRYQQNQPAFLKKLCWMVLWTILLSAFNSFIIIFCIKKSVDANCFSQCLVGHSNLSMVYFCPASHPNPWHYYWWIRVGQIKSATMLDKLTVTRSSVSSRPNSPRNRVSVDVVHCQWHELKLVQIMAWRLVEPINACVLLILSLGTHLMKC